MNQQNIIVKILLIGSSNVGKSSIILRISSEKFRESYIPTLGVQFKNISLNIDQKKFKCQIWEIGGNNNYHKIGSIYFKNTQIFFLVFLYDKKDTLENLSNYLKDINIICPEGKKVLIGNWINQQLNQIDQEQVSKFKQKWNIQQSYRINAKQQELNYLLQNTLSKMSFEKQKFQPVLNIKQKSLFQRFIEEKKISKVDVVLFTFILLSLLARLHLTFFADNKSISNPKNQQKIKKAKSKQLNSQKRKKKSKSKSGKKGKKSQTQNEQQL